MRRGQTDPGGRIASGGATGGPTVDDDYLYTVVDALDVVAKDTGKTVPQIALNWLLQQPSVANLVIGARNEEQLRQNLGALDWTLSPQHRELLDDASRRPPVYPYWHQTGFDERNPKPTRW
jgi:aryl-alcohol dehydrogenase-like predicted oxidoreductase